MNDTKFRNWDERDITELLALEPLGPRRFRSRFGQVNEHGRTYGGQLMGQALMAAALTAPAGRSPTMMQFLFLQGAAPDQAIEFEVADLQNGKRFTSRHVRGAQAESRFVCDAQVSFALPLAAPTHMAPPPSGLAAQDPETLPRLSDLPLTLAADIERVLGYRLVEAGFLDFRVRGVADIALPESPEPRMGFWIKTRQRLPDDPFLQAAAFVYISDWWINFASCGAQVRPMIEARRRLYIASLNHAIWLHRPLRADEWMLFDCVSPSAADGRGLTIGRVYDREGRLLACATQECLIAPFDE